MRADLPCYLLLYTQSGTRNPADPRWQDSRRLDALYVINDNTP